MEWLTPVFVVALTAEAVVRLWLSSRQAAAVRAHRDQVPERFQDQVALAEHQKAADYTVARVRVGRLNLLLDVGIRLAFTLGGGIAFIDALWGRSHLAQPWHGALVIGTVLFALMLLHLPLSIWRTFRLEARFGFNRITPRLFVLDLVKELAVLLLLASPVVFGALLLMDRAGRWWWFFAWLSGRSTRCSSPGFSRVSLRRYSIASRRSRMRRSSPASSSWSRAAGSRPTASS